MAEKKRNTHEQMRDAAAKVLAEKKADPPKQKTVKDAKGDSTTARAFRAMGEGW